jgi:MFS family permease
MTHNIAAASRRQRGIMITVFVAFFTSFFVQNGISIALPRIAAELNGMAYFSWAVSIPALSTALAVLIFGKLSDIFGRRGVMLVSVILVFFGAILSAFSRSFVLLIIALSIQGMGQGAIQPLCFSIIGDLYNPIARSKWVGLLNIVSGVTALFVPTLSGWFVDHLSWRMVFWVNVPIAVITGLLILLGLPKLLAWEKRKIDTKGAFWLTIASSALVLGISLAGGSYEWFSLPVIGLLCVSLVSWGILYKIETSEKEPMLDPKVITNRTFITASLSALFSLLSFTAITVYLPLFLQGVQDHSATFSGQVITPFGILVSFMGIPAGFLIAKTRRYKWMYVVGYGLLTLVMFGTVFLNANTPIAWSIVITTAAGIGLGTIPTVNALVVQHVVPKRLMGVATGTLYFFVMMGRAISPAVLGSIMNGVYDRVLFGSLTQNMDPFLSGISRDYLSDPRVLLSSSAKAEMFAAFSSAGEKGIQLFDRSIQAVKSALEASLHTVFMIGAFAMLVSFFLILTIPDVPLDMQEH